MGLHLPSQVSASGREPGWATVLQNLVRPEFSLTPDPCPALLLQTDGSALSLKRCDSAQKQEPSLSLSGDQNRQEGD